MVMGKSKGDDLKGTKMLMGTLVRMKPKPHEDMKVGTKVKKKVAKKKTVADRSKPRA
jgi:poly-gamma-glutamate capsule biosynthesis protein CapA/YwtB (metallophosphatase superfamily)